MLYTCAPARTGSATIKAKRRGGTAPGITVDIHCHVLTPAADDLVKPLYKPESDPLYLFANDATREVNRQQGQSIRAKITSVEKRLAAMDKLGIDMQTISPA